MRRSGLALLGALAGLGAAPPTLRDRIADGVYLESAEGDYAAAAVHYRSVADEEGAPEHLRAEALFRLGLAEERRGETDNAASSYVRLLVEVPTSRWAEEARSRLQAVDEDRKRVGALPVEFRFERSTDGLVHAGTRSNKGSLQHERLEDEQGPHEVAAWRTYVVAREDDLTQIGFAPALIVGGELEVVARAVSFPTHLIFFLVDAEGRRFGTTTQVLRPEDGWRSLQFRADDFLDRSGGAEVAYSPVAITNLWIQDVTGYASTDRGENVLWIDELTLR